MKLKILVGTMTSTADYVAQAIQMDCADLVDDIEVQLMDGLDISPSTTRMRFISSAVPPTAPATSPTTPATLYDSLDTHPKFLGHVRYGVIALGDRTYLQTFCFGGKKFDERLQGLGAQRIGEVWCHDASAGTMPEEEGTAWCRSG
jgi:MioC protein